MAIAEVFIKEAEALLAPISAAEPGGSNPSSDERYQELRLEVDKENSPIGEAVVWARVEALGREILGKVAKDLLVAAYTAFALHKTKGVHGLAVGLLVLDGLFDRFWGVMYPPVARLKGRGTALRWLLEHAAGTLQSYQPNVADRAAIAALVEVSKQLRGRARDKLGDHVPSFKEWTDLLESIQQTLPPEPKSEPAPAVPSGHVHQDMPKKPDTPVAPAAAPVAAPAAPPPEAAAAPPAAPARPTAKDLAGPWLAPIAGPSPAGRDPTESTEYQNLLAEIDKLQSPTGGAIDWAAIVRDADTVLKSQAKDLRVVCHQALARFKTARIDGLALGLAIVAEVADAFWDSAFPPAARLRGRAGALRALLEQVEPELSAWQPKPSERAALEQLKDSATRLQAVVRARYADQAPNLRSLLQSIDQLLLTIPAPAPPKPEPPPPPPKVEAPPPPPKVEAPPPVPQNRVEKPAVVVEPPKAAAAPAGDPGNAAAVDRYLRNTGEELVKLAHALRRARTSDPLAYRLLRSGLWIYIAAPPPVRPDGNTAINGLPEAERARLEAMLGNGKWADVIESSESLLPMNRFCLDLHRFTVEALRNLGPDHDLALRGLLAEVGALLTRLPKVFDLKDNNGEPLCDATTRALLEREALGGGGGGAGAPIAASVAIPAAATAGAPAPIVIAAPAASGVDDAAIAQIKGLLRSKREEGLRLGAARVQSAAGGRSRLLRRLELAEACLDGGEVGLARSLFAGLVQELDAQRLEAWEPELAARCLEGHVRSAPRTQPAEKAAVDAAIARLAGLDPLRAAALVPKG